MNLLLAHLHQSIKWILMKDSFAALIFVIVTKTDFAHEPFLLILYFVIIIILFFEYFRKKMCQSEIPVFGEVILQLSCSGPTAV
jgi:hypothetical protein